MEFLEAKKIMEQKMGGFENYFSVYGISSYSDDIKAIKSDYVMMVNSAKDMFSDTETLKDVHFDTMSYLYFENQGRNAVYIDAVDDNDRYTKKRKPCRGMCLGGLLFRCEEFQKS